MNYEVKSLATSLYILPRTPQFSQQCEVPFVSNAVLRGLQDRRHIGEALVGDEHTEGDYADLSLPDVCVYSDRKSVV